MPNHKYESRRPPKDVRELLWPHCFEDGILNGYVADLGL